MTEKMIKNLVKNAVEVFDITDIQSEIRKTFDFFIAYLAMFGNNKEMLLQLKNSCILGWIFVMNMEGEKATTYLTFVSELVKYLRIHSWDDQEKADMWLEAAQNELDMERIPYPTSYPIGMGFGNV